MKIGLFDIGNFMFVSNNEIEENKINICIYKDFNRDQYVVHVFDWKCSVFLPLLKDPKASINAGILTVERAKELRDFLNDILGDNEK